MYKELQKGPPGSEAAITENDIRVKLDKDSSLPASFVLGETILLGNNQRVYKCSLKTNESRVEEESVKDVVFLNEEVVKKVP